MTIRLAIVVPCYNEEEVLPETNRRLLALLTRLSESELALLKVAFTMSTMAAIRN